MTINCLGEWWLHWSRTPPTTHCAATKVRLRKCGGQPCRGAGMHRPRSSRYSQVASAWKSVIKRRSSRSRGRSAWTTGPRPETLRCSCTRTTREAASRAGRVVSGSPRAPRAARVALEAAEDALAVGRLEEPRGMLALGLPLAGGRERWFGLIRDRDSDRRQRSGGLQARDRGSEHLLPGSAMRATLRRVRPHSSNVRSPLPATRRDGSADAPDPLRIGAGVRTAPTWARPTGCKRRRLCGRRSRLRYRWPRWARGRGR